MSQNSPAFTHSVTIDRPADEVWQALTRKQIVDRYYLAPIGADVSAPGEEIFYGTSDNKMIVGTLLKVDPPRELRHTFRFGQADGDSVVTYSLEPAGDATTVVLVHEGYEPDSQSYADIAMGWPIILNQLKQVVEAE